MKVKKCKKGLISLEVALIEYCKAYVMIPDIWIQKYMEMFGSAVNGRSFVNTIMKQCNTKLTASNQRSSSLIS